jgi:hypothetical protein
MIGTTKGPRYYASSGGRLHSDNAMISSGVVKYSEDVPAIKQIQLNLG